MTIDLWTSAGNILSDLALLDTVPLSSVSLWALLASYLASLALGMVAARLRIPPWICWAVFAAMVAKELLFDIPRGGFGWEIWADSHNDLILPVLGYLFAFTPKKGSIYEPIQNPGGREKGHGGPVSKDS